MTYVNEEWHPTLGDTDVSQLHCVINDVMQGGRDSFLHNQKLGYIFNIVIFTGGQI